MPPSRPGRRGGLISTATGGSFSTGGEVEIADFGIFHVQDLKERRLYVPKRKETIVIPARRAVKFREAGKLRERLNPAPVADDN